MLALGYRTEKRPPGDHAAGLGDEEAFGEGGLEYGAAGR